MCVSVCVSGDMHACVCMMYMHGWVLSINVCMHVYTFICMYVYMGSIVIICKYYYVCIDLNVYMILCVMREHG